MTNSPQEPADLSDPAISPHRLQELAQTHPEAWDEILAHPNVYPGLSEWIRDRQAEQAGTQQFTAESADESGAEYADDATKVFEPVDADEFREDTSDGEAIDPEPDPVNDEAEVDSALTESFAAVHESGDDPAAADEADSVAEQPAPSWATPEPNSQQSSSSGSTAAEPARNAWTSESSQQASASAATPQGEPLWGWPGPDSSSTSHAQHQAPPAGYGQPSYGYHQPQQPPYGYGQPQGQQYQYSQQYAQSFQAPRRERTPIDLNSARTWGLFVTGGAAFMTLFGFFFSPTMGGFGLPLSSHLASAGWLILLLFLATVTLSILQLLKPSQWLRYFFILVSFGAAFTMIGRTTALIGFFSMQNTSFSVIWMLFMSLVLLAGIMVYTAPKSPETNGGSASPRQGQQAPQQFGYQQPPMQQPGYGPQSGQPPYGGSGQQPGGYPSGPQH